MAYDRNELAEKIRELWVRERRMYDFANTGIASTWGDRYMPYWDGGQTDDGKQHCNIWLRIAEQCIDNNLEPTILVRSAFHNRDMVPKPNQALGPKAIQRYQMYGAPSTILEFKQTIETKLKFEKSKAATEVFRLQHYSKLSEQDSWQIVIGNTSLPLSPLFRFCVAVMQNWQDLADKFRQKAINQYERHRELYDEVWAEWIPSTLKAANKEAVG